MSRGDLFEVADRQQGYFTAQQAVECGIARSAFHYRLASGEWEREGRGIYRLVHYPVSEERPELVYWSLWSRSKEGIPQGVWSHETALDIHGLSDLMPEKMHMTVPSRFRRNVEIPDVLRIHYANIDPEATEQRRGYRVTKPLKTILDVIESGRVSEEHIVRAIRDGLASGKILRRHIAQSAATAELRRIMEAHAI